MADKRPLYSDGGEINQLPLSEQDSLALNKLIIAGNSSVEQAYFSGTVLDLRQSKTIVRMLNYTPAKSEINDGEIVISNNGSGDVRLWFNMGGSSFYFPMTML